MDVSLTDYFAVRVARFADGYVRLEAACEGDHLHPGVEIRREYRPGVQLDDVIDDACRLVCGWGALGMWGLVDAGHSLPSVGEVA